MKTILVTGGAGYIGSHACKVLAAAGFEPVVFDDLSNGHRDAVRYGPLVTGDVRDSAALGACMQRHAVQGVIHFAGLIEVGRSVQDPAAFWDVNLNGVASVLAAMRAQGVRRIVFSSTAAVYGQAGSGLLDETAAACPVNPYGDSKLAAERLIAAHARAHGVEGVALRYFNASGADPQGQLGEAHQPESHLIPLALEAALGFGPPLKLFGLDFPTPDGACVRDFIHVADLAQAHVAALTVPTGEAGFLAMNLGLGRGLSVLEIIAAVERTTGRPVPWEAAPRRAGDPPVLVADPGLARRRLDWSPTFTDIDAIIGTALAWRLAPRFGPATAHAHVA
nr:UDP-glucose 4-epimerase GalE [Brevundimonas naejangsanensis]